MSDLSHILLVEDDPDIRMLASLVLVEMGGFRLDEAQNGTEALAYLANNTPDLVLMDMMMPELDGINTLARMKADSKLSAVPVVFMTARVQASEVEGYILAGALGVITKPFDPMTLVTQITQIWERSL